MRVNPIINSFADGVLDPLLGSRVDLKMFPHGCREMKNFWPYAAGGATFRPGSKYVASTKETLLPVVLVDFVYSDSVAYMLEFGDRYLRVCTAGGQVQSGGSPVEVVTPWSAYDLRQLRYDQIADTMFLVCPGYPPYQLYRTSPTTWTLEAYPNEWGPFLKQNDTAVTLTPSAITGTGITLTASAATFVAGHVGAQFKIDGPEVIAGTLTAAAQTIGPISIDKGDTITVELSGTWVATVRIQRSYDGGSTWLDYIEYTANAGIEITSLEDGVQYRLYCQAYTSGTVTGRLARPSAPGYMTITAVASPTSATADVVEDLPSTDATTSWSEGAWSAYRGYPRAVRFYEQRLEFAGTTYRPLTVTGSCIDDYVNHDLGASNDDDAYTYTLAGSRINAILWMVATDILYVATNGGEWRFGNRDEATTPNNPPNAKVQTAHGSADIQGLLVGSSILFMQRGGKALMSSGYDYREEKYVSFDQSEKAAHLLRSGVVAMHYQARPIPTVWMLMNTGTLVGCVWRPEHEVAAFFTVETDGFIEDFNIIPGEERDEMWWVVKREVDGSVVRYMEQMQPLSTTIEEGTYIQDVYGTATVTPAAAASNVYAINHTAGTCTASTSPSIGWNPGSTPDTSEDTYVRIATSGITHGDTVLSATLTFENGRSPGDTLSSDLPYLVAVELSDDATLPASYADYTSRVANDLSDAMEGAIPAGYYAQGTEYTTADFAASLQEVVDREGFASGAKVGIYLQHVESAAWGDWMSRFSAGFYDFTLTVVYQTKTGEVLLSRSSLTDSFCVDCGLTFNNAAVITDITQADPAVVSAYGHGFTNGMTVYLSGIGGMTDLNDTTATVANADSYGFELDGVDSTGFDAYTGGGLAEQVATVITGLDHLEGRTVAIYADGMVDDPDEVSGGSITLLAAARKAHIGIGYEGIIRPNPPEAGAQAGTAQGRLKQTFHPIVRLVESYGLSVGPDEDNLTDGDVFTNGELFTGDMPVEIFPNEDLTDGGLVLQHDDPAPCTVTGVIYTVSTSDL